MFWRDQILLIYFLYFNLRSTLCVATTEPPDDSDPVEMENCVLVDYKAACSIRILDELIQVSVSVNQCHLPLDITFKIVYKYGEGASHHWQYTFVTSNQNERVLIPGLSLPITPHALIYLYVRVPQPLFALHNSTLAAVEASLVGVLSENEWEEVEFLNDTAVVGKAEVCPNGRLSIKTNKQRTFFIVGGSLMGLLLVCSSVVFAIWFYRRRKLAREHRNLVNSVETGLPGAEPYQLGAQNLNNSTSTNPAQRQIDKTIPDSLKTNQSETTTNESKPKANGFVSGFKFGRLKEEGSEDTMKEDTVKQDTVRKLEKAYVIGNPVLVDKSAMFEDGVSGGNNNNVCGTIRNQNADDENCDGNGNEEEEWKHPLESGSEKSENFGARPKMIPTQLELKNRNLESKEELG